jgi:hypothetical protein
MNVTSETSLFGRQQADSQQDLRAGSGLIKFHKRHQIVAGAWIGLVDGTNSFVHLCQSSGSDLYTQLYVQVLS